MPRREWTSFGNHDELPISNINQSRVGLEFEGRKFTAHGQSGGPVIDCQAHLIYGPDKESRHVGKEGWHRGSYPVPWDGVFF